MVLNMNVPQGTDLQALKSVLPIFLCYVLSFIYVGIYWNNHHHLLHASEHVTGGILWAKNLVLLFCLSLAPFTTAWMGVNHYAPLPVALYGVMLLLAGVAYFILTRFPHCASWEELGSGEVDWQRLERNGQCAGLTWSRSLWPS